MNNISFVIDYYTEDFLFSSLILSIFITFEQINSKSSSSAIASDITVSKFLFSLLLEGYLMASFPKKSLYIQFGDSYFCFLNNLRNQNYLVSCFFEDFFIVSSWDLDFLYQNFHFVSSSTFFFFDCCGISFQVLVLL